MRDLELDGKLGGDGDEGCLHGAHEAHCHEQCEEIEVFLPQRPVQRVILIIGRLRAEFCRGISARAILDGPSRHRR